MMLIYDWMTLNPGTTYLGLLLFSLCIGSLLNAMIYRIPLMLKENFTHECRSFLALESSENEKTNINLFFPRSFCPFCRHTIRAWHNIPLFSYLFLRGKCADCHHPISLRYPFIEALYAGLTLFSAYHFGFTIYLIFAMIFIALILMMAFIDLDTQLLPDGLTYSLLWIGLIFNTQNYFISPEMAILSAAGAYCSLWLFIQLFYLITGKIGMGQGDFKLFAAFGAWFGASHLILIILLASFIGAIIGFIYLKNQNQPTSTPIPFGPFLCFAGLISLFYGQRIIETYLTML
jgi:leader peptidase (prepilin peptidase)/N-methyltransferase